MGSVTPLELARLFPTTELADIGDELADGLFGGDPAAPQPLALFDALRTDFSLARLRHYTGTAPEHFNAISCSPTITAMSTNSSPGRGRRSGRAAIPRSPARSEEHTSELQSLMRISYAVFCLKKKNRH